MKNNDTVEFVNKYFDGELDKNSETFLFTKLSLDEEAREYFKKVQVLNSSIVHEDFPDKLDEKILNSVKNTKEKFFFSEKNIFQFALAVLLIFFIVSTYTFYSETIEYKSILNSTIKKVNHQEQTIDALLKSLPAVEVESETPNLIVIEANRS